MRRRDDRRDVEWKDEGVERYRDNKEDREVEMDQAFSGPFCCLLPDTIIYQIGSFDSLSDTVLRGPSGLVLW